jgi:hypothetical protein
MLEGLNRLHRRSGTDDLRSVFSIAQRLQENVLSFRRLPGLAEKGDEIRQLHALSRSLGLHEPCPRLAERIVHGTVSEDGAIGGDGAGAESVEIELPLPKGKPGSGGEEKPQEGRREQSPPRKNQETIRDEGRIDSPRGHAELRQRRKCRESALRGGEKGAHRRLRLFPGVKTDQARYLAPCGAAIVPKPLLFLFGKPLFPRTPAIENGKSFLKEERTEIFLVGPHHAAVLSRIGGESKGNGPDRDGRIPVDSFSKTLEILSGKDPRHAASSFPVSSDNEGKNLHVAESAPERKHLKTQCFANARHI